MTKKLIKSLTINDKKRLIAFGQQIERLRNLQKLTIYDVTGIDMPVKSRQHWRRIEAGKKNINLTTFFKIAETLNIKPEELIKDI